MTAIDELIVSNCYRLQKENEHLVGKYSIHSQQLQSEMINLPNTVQVRNNKKLLVKRIIK